MILKKLREIVDSSQGNSNSNNNKEKMQAISLIMECYTKKTEFFDAKPIVDGFKEIVDQTKKSEQETKEKKEFKTILQMQI